MRKHLLATVLYLSTAGLSTACADARATDCSALTKVIGAAKTLEDAAPGTLSAHYQDLSAALGALEVTDAGAARSVAELRRALNAAAASTDAAAARGGGAGSAAQDLTSNAVDAAEKDLIAYCIGSAF